MIINCQVSVVYILIINSQLSTAVINTKKLQLTNRLHRFPAKAEK